MSLLTEIADHLAGYVGMSVTPGDGRFLDLSLANGNSYEVSLDGFDEDEDDPIGDHPMSQDYPRPDSLTDHVSLLDAILHGIARSSHRNRIKGLTSDGDGTGCEAIFDYLSEPSILKVRWRRTIRHRQLGRRH